MAKAVRALLNEGRRVVIHDIRFPNEARLVSSYMNAGLLVKLERVNADGTPYVDGVAGTAHDSEALVDTIDCDLRVVQPTGVPALLASVEEGLRARGFIGGGLRMKIVKQSWQFEEPVDGEAILAKIERAGRTCYKSEDKITPESARKFVANCIKSGHHSVIEHHNITVRIITDRGVTYEIVRHRLASYSQESTRYCNYSGDKFGKEITVILPVWFYGEKINAPGTAAHGAEDISDNPVKRGPQYVSWLNACEMAEEGYFKLIEQGQTPQESRSVLPNSLKTEIVMTANVREWRHFFTLRASPKSHPQMVALAQDMLRGFRAAVPVLFDDIHAEIV